MNFELREFARRDIAARVEWINGELGQAGLNVQGPVSVASTLAWYERIDKDPGRRDYAFDRCGSLVGLSGLTSIDRDACSAELYAMVNPKTVKQGIGSKLVLETCRSGFEDLELERIYLWMFSDNIAAERLYRKCGFQLEGVLRRHAFRDGAFRDRSVMGILKEEWTLRSADDGNVGVANERQA